MTSDLKARGRQMLAAAMLGGVCFVCPPSLAQDADGADGADGADAAGDEGETFVEALYGKRIEAVQRTRDSKDDRALMQEMLEIAPTLPSEPDAKTALYVRIAAMTERSRVGHDLAIEALDALAQHKPKHPSADPEAKLAVYASWYRAADRSERKEVAEDYFDLLAAAGDRALAQGDTASAKRWYNEAGSVQRVNRLERDFDLRDKLAVVRAHERMLTEVKELEAAATANAISPTQARRLVVLLALEMGNFEQAESYAVFVKDADFVKGLRAATEMGGRSITQGGDHPPGLCYQAGQWYAGLIDEPDLSETTAEQTLLLARIALHRYVQTTTQSDIAKARTTIQLRQLDERYMQAYGPKVDENDLLTQLDPSKHVIYGKAFTRRGDKLILPPKTIVHLPAEGGDHYVLDLKVQGDGAGVQGLMLWLPVGGKSARLIVDSDTHRSTVIVGLQTVEGSNQTMRLERGETAHLQIEVMIRPAKDDEREAVIAFSFNNSKPWTWKSSVDKFEDPPYGTPPNIKHFSLSGGGGLEIESLKLERVEKKK